MNTTYYIHKNYKVTGVDKNSSTVTVTLNATSKQEAIKEAKKLNIIRIKDVRI